MTQLVRPARTYGQFCPVAAALDLVGDRWVLLIIREMLFGKRRFSEIKRACPGIAPNLLSERLRNLTDRGLVNSDATGYTLTEQGQAVQPVLRALAVFGMQHLDDDESTHDSPEDMDAVRIARSFLLPYHTYDLPQMRVRVIAPDGSRVDVLKDDSHSLATLAESEGAPDVTIEADGNSLWLARRDGIPFECDVYGSKQALADFISGYGLEGLIKQ